MGNGELRALLRLEVVLVVRVLGKDHGSLEFFSALRDRPHNRLGFGRSQRAGYKVVLHIDDDEKIVCHGISWSNSPPWGVWTRLLYSPAAAGCGPVALGWSSGSNAFGIGGNVKSFGQMVHAHCRARRKADNTLHHIAHQLAAIFRRCARRCRGRLSTLPRSHHVHAFQALASHS